MQECKYDAYKNTSSHLLDQEILGDARCKLAIFLLGLLGGFTQKQITQALPKAKNNGIVETVCSIYRYRFGPTTTSSSSPRSVVVRLTRRSWLDG